MPEHDTHPAPASAPSLIVPAILLGGLTLASTAFIASTSTVTLVAYQLTGGAAASGLTLAAGILGTSAGTTLLSSAMTRLPRSLCLALSYLLAALGAAAVVLAIVTRSFPLLIGGMLVMGCGQAATPLTRYVMAELFNPEQRGRALSLAVWIGTVGAVVGPSLMGPSASLSGRLGWPEHSVLYVLVTALFLLAALLYVLVLGRQPQLRAPAACGDTSRTPLGQVLANPQVQVAVSTLVVGHVVMVLIMAMTPLHLQGSGHHLGAVGLVMSAHVVGMFGFAPLFGWLVDRWGSVPVISLGLILLVGAGSGAALTTSHAASMAALFVLGVGWNLGFVAGSALLTRGFDGDERVRVSLQGRVDTLIWMAAAAASASSSLVLSWLGYPGLCWLAITLVSIPALLLAINHGRISGPSATLAPAAD